MLLGVSFDDSYVIQLKRSVGGTSKLNSIMNIQIHINNEKIYLFKSIFKGRQDVFAKYWESSKTGKRGYSPKEVV